MIGVLEDGFPVNGNLGLAGAIVTNEDLDECSGHVEATPEFPEGIYHYHLTADEAPCMIDCYHGEGELVPLSQITRTSRAQHANSPFSTRTCKR